MTRFFAPVSTLLLLTAIGQPAAAAVFERDWKTPGDGLLTYDDVNGREWLDVTESLLLNFDVSPFHNAYNNVVAQTMPGGVFEGFKVAQSGDVIALAQSAGIDTTTLDFDTNAVPAAVIIDLLGPTVGRPISEGSRGAVVLGYLEITQGTAFFQYGAADGPGDEARAGLAIGLGAGADLIRPASTGVMLFREVVPEPLSFLLFATVLTALLLSQREVRLRH